MGRTATLDKCMVVITKGKNAGEICGDIHKTCTTQAHMRTNKSQPNNQISNILPIQKSLINNESLNSLTSINSQDLLSTVLKNPSGTQIIGTINNTNNINSDSDDSKTIKELKIQVEVLQKQLQQYQPAQQVPVMYFDETECDFFKIKQKHYNWNNDQMFDHITGIILKATSISKFSWIIDMYNLINKKAPIEINPIKIMTWDGKKKKKFRITIKNKNGSETIDDGLIFNKIGNNILTNALLYSINHSVNESIDRNKYESDDHNKLFQSTFGKYNLYDKLNIYKNIKPTENHLKDIISSIT